MTTRPDARPTRPARVTDSPVLTLAWFAVVLAVTFTIAFWLGRTVGPTPAETEHAPLAPHSRSGH